MTPTFRVCVYQMTPAALPAGTDGNQRVCPRSDQLYEQTVEALDLQRLIAAVNHKPRAPRKPRTPKP